MIENISIIRNQILKVFKDEFTGPGSINLPISDSKSFEEIGSTGNLAAWDREDVTIYLSNDSLANSSKEFIVNAIIHEMQHAIFYYQTGDYGTKTLEQYHQKMISFVNQAAEILVDLFNISEKEAYALSLSGLGDVINNDMNDIFKMTPQEIMNKMDLLDKYGLTSQEIDNIAFNYYKGIKGTSCNE